MQTQYYKNKNNELYFEPSQEIISRDGLEEITESEFQELLEIKNTPTQEQLLEQKIQEAKQYLQSTDWIVTKINEAQILGEAIQPLLDKYETELLKRSEMREVINSL